MPPILIQKWAHQIVKHAYHQTAHFFMTENDHYLGYIISFDYVLPPPLTFLKITNGSLRHRSFFLNTSSLDLLTNMITITCTGAMAYI